MAIEKISDKKRYSLYKISSPDLPKNSFLIRTKVASDILYSPYLAGKRLQDLQQDMGRIFARAMRENALTDEKFGQVTELVLLAGGLYYFLNEGFKQECNFALQQCFLGIQRARIEGSEGQFTARAGYENFEALPDNATVIIGDTIATGATLQKSTQLLLDAAEAKGKNIRKIIICTVAGSHAGAKKVAEMEKHLQKEYPGASLYFFAANQLFHLMPDGTDLRFFGPTAMMPEETKKETLEKYGEYLASNMKCAVFDWGTRCKNPRAYYADFLGWAQEELKGGKVDKKGRQMLEGMAVVTRRELEEFEKRI
jgi:uracil phosphoribosyltransferase